MSKLNLTKPLLIMMYGFPGSGKTHFARELSDILGAAHIQGDRIRYELFENPRYDKEENAIVAHIMDYMTEVLLHAGVSVVYDTHVLRLAQRRALRDMARKNHAGQALIWLQIDHESAFARVSGRDRRKIDDKYAAPLTKDQFETLIAAMQNPKDEDYIVISGKHTFNTQRGTVIKKFYELGYLDSDTMMSKVVKPGLVNLIPNPMAGRVDSSRRNIIIR
jgi:predicted kinase